MAEHCAMLSMIFSPRNSGSRMIKRLAEINLVNGDDEAALKYLRILDKTLLHKSWAEKRIPGQQTPRVKEWLEKKRRDIPTQDHLRSGNDAVTSLRNLVASNAGNLRAYEYLLCYHLLSKDLRSFVEDYVPGKVSSSIFAEALLIHLARQGNIRAEELIKYQIPVKIAKEFADYTRLYEAKDTSLKEKYGKTYWFYYHLRPQSPERRVSHERSKNHEREHNLLPRLDNLLAGRMYPYPEANRGYHRPNPHVSRLYGYHDSHEYCPSQLLIEKRCGRYASNLKREIKRDTIIFRKESYFPFKPMGKPFRAGSGQPPANNRSRPYQG